VEKVFERLRGGDTLETLGVIGLLVAIVGIIAFIVFVEAARRRIPVSYAKRHVGRQWSATQTTMPLKINMGGVIRSSLHRRFFRCLRVFRGFSTGSKPS